MGIFFTDSGITKKKYNNLLFVGYLFALIFQILNLLGILIPETTVKSFSLLYPDYTHNFIFILFLLYLCGFNFYTIMKLYRKQRIERLVYLKKKYKWIFIGLLFGQLGVLDYLPFFFSFDWWQSYGSYFTVIGIFILFFAFLKYDVDTPNKTVKKAVIISTVSIILLMINILFIMTLYSIIKIKISALQISLIIIPFFIFLISYEKLRKTIAKKILILFFPKQKESLQLLSLYNDILIKSIDIAEMITQVSNIIKEQFGSFNCALYLSENENTLVLENRFGEIEVRKKNRVILLSQEIRQSLLTYDFICVCDNKSSQLNNGAYSMFCQKDFFGFNEGLIIPLVYKKQVLGVLVFSEKGNDGLFDESDFYFIKILKSELSLVLHNIRLIEKENRKKLIENTISLKKRFQNYNDRDFEGVVSNNGKIIEIFDTIKAISDKNITVLITGESGTGKELFAKAIHQKSKRKEKPFITINCAAIPRDLLEAELFGYEKGAFTGAFKTHIGKFEEADGGTIFLDEIAEIKPFLQVKLLRFIESKTVERIGSSKKIHLDVRIIGATNKDLENMVKNSTFREDLFYRLNIVRIKLPPLRNRREDINLLVWHYLTQISKEYRIKIPKIAADAMSILETYNWPGNIRELKNTIARILAINNNLKIIKKENIPKHILDVVTPHISAYNYEQVFADGILNKTYDLKTWLEDYEKMMILEVFKRTNGNQSETAKVLNIGRSSLQYKLKKYGIK